MQTQIIWQALEEPATEHLMIGERADGGFDVESTVVGVIDQQPFTLRYAVHLDQQWRVRSVTAEIPYGWNRVDLTSDGQGTWSNRESGRVEHLQGCIDIDIMASPFTNTLPIRRLQLEISEAVEIDVVYLPVPSLEISPRRQRYTRLGDRLYRFESLRDAETVFAADIVVDRDGFVVDYPGLFRRIYPEASGD